MLKPQNLETLFSENAGLLRLYAARFAWVCKRDPALSVDDLVQVGFFALVEAARTFDTKSGKSWAGWVRWNFAAEVRRLLGRAARSSESCALSLDAPVGDDSEGASLVDLLPDDSLPDPAEGLESADDAAALHAAIDRLRDDLEKSVILAHGLHGQSVAAVAEAQGCTTAAAQNALARAKAHLRGDWRLKRAVLTTWGEAPNFSVGVEAFKSSGSAVERAIVWAEEHDRHF